MRNKYIAMDVETGGIGTDKSLLTAYFAVLDEEFNITDTLLLNVKPKDKIYHVTAEALNINKIDLIEHDKVALAEEECGTKLYEFLKKVNPNPKKENKLIPIGHNVAFDIRFIQNKLISKGSWDTFASYRVLDTGVIGQTLQVAGILPNNITASLVSLAKYFKIPTSAAHTADGDVLMSVAVLTEMLDRIK